MTIPGAKMSLISIGRQRPPRSGRLVHRRSGNGMKKKDPHIVCLDAAQGRQSQGGNYLIVRDDGDQSRSRMGTTVLVEEQDV
jgi:hypothetical protein